MFRGTRVLLGAVLSDLADGARIQGRFTVDRLPSIINRLGSRVDVKITVRRARTTTQGVPA